MASGASLGVLTGMAVTAGATAAAVFISQVALVSTMAVTFLNACEELGRAIKRLNSPEYWMKDSLAQLKTLQETFLIQARANFKTKKTTWMILLMPKTERH